MYAGVGGVCAHEYRYPQKPEGGIRFLCAEVIGDPELPDVRFEN